MRISLPTLFVDALAETAAELLLAVFAPFALADLYEPPAVVECRVEHRDQARRTELQQLLIGTNIERRGAFRVSGARP